MPSLAAGNVKFVFVQRQRKNIGRRFCFAFIRFSSIKDDASTIKFLDGFKWGALPCRFRSKGPSERAEAEMRGFVHHVQSRKLFITSEFNRFILSLAGPT